MAETSKYLILCVDDEKIILDSLKKELQNIIHLPYELEIAQNGHDALELMQEFLEDGYEIPLVITDYIMPKMKGDELLRNISQLSPKTFGILLTGQADLEGVRNSVRYGRLQSFLLKPWEAVDLTGDIKKTLSLYEQEKKIQLQNKALKNLNTQLEKIVENKTQELIIQNQKLIELNQEKDNLMGIVAHDLRSPINNIVGCLELVRLSDSKIDEISTYFQIINKEIDKAYNLIDDLLVISKHNLSEKELNISQISLLPLVQKLLENFLPKADKKNISLHLQSDNPDVSLATDESLLERILENLLSNALKFSPFHKNIWVLITQNTTSINIKIKDEGQGFTEDDKELVFQKFQKLSAQPTGKETSTGLGLSIVKIFTERLGGHISLESEKGQGSTFSLILPIK